MVDHVLSILLDNERFVIITHIRPDGDAIGSQLALGRFLAKLGKEVLMINSDPPTDNLEWMSGAEAIEVFDGALEQRRRIAEADVVIVIDTNTMERIGKVAEAVKRTPALKLLIDHHPDPEPWFDEAYARVSASSVGELVYELITAHDADLIDEPIATALYTAIMTDTGSFRYSSVTPQVHYIVADLLERGGIQPDVIHSSLFDTRTLPGLRLLSLALDSIRLCYDGQVGYMVVSLRMLNKSGASHDDTEGFVNYVLSIYGVRAALLFTETPSGTKVSFRSKGELPVNEWAQAFGGGGHRNASGAYIERSLDETIGEVIKTAPKYLDVQEPSPDTQDKLSAEDEDYLSTLLDLKSQQPSS